MASGDTKAKLRAQLKQARLGLSDAECTLKSRAINKRLKKLVDWPAVSAVHYFEPLRQLMEVDLSDLITYLEDNHSGIQLAAPHLINGAWQMVSAKSKKPPKSFDIILVPMLGFDPETLHRIGYGGGYYDKFLATQPKARKIGVCYEAGKTAGIPVEPHDVPLDTVVTEKNTYFNA